LLVTSSGSVVLQLSKYSCTNCFHRTESFATWSQSLKAASLVLISSGRIFCKVLAKLLLQDSCGCPSFLGRGIHAPRNFLGNVSSDRLTILPIYRAVLLSMKASIFGILQKSLLICEFFIRCSLTWSHLILNIHLMKV
jgi:hypothetical protein